MVDAGAPRGVGLDLVEVDRVATLIARWGDRFLDRVFTPAELRLCRGQAHRLAGRLAAKEAVLKAMGIGLRLGNWRDIEVGRDSLGAPVVRLKGRLSEEACRRGIDRFAVSITHTRGLAMAIVLAMAEEG
ncbi:MAG TPA: holo-[acyl-carrier-protein] synthase [Clostridiales bacterium]|nr:holo-[acyl-carrier-protein] synthase [Clostridiales bacterium]